MATQPLETGQDLPLTADRIEALLKDKESLYFKEYQEALLKLAEHAAIERKIAYLYALLEQQEADRERAEIRYAQLIQQLEKEKEWEREFYSSTSHPKEMILLHEIEEIKKIDAALFENHKNIAQVLIHYQEAQTSYADHIVEQYCKKPLTLPDGTQLSLTPPAETLKEIRENLAKMPLPEQILEKIPQKREAVLARRQEIFEKLAEKNKTLPISEQKNLLELSDDANKESNKELINGRMVNKSILTDVRLANDLFEQYADLFREKGVHGVVGLLKVLQKNYASPKEDQAYRSMMEEKNNQYCRLKDEAKELLHKRQDATNSLVATLVKVGYQDEKMNAVLNLIHSHFKVEKEEVKEEQRYRFDS